jgi:hypothetical protein
MNKSFLFILGLLFPFSVFSQTAVPSLTGVTPSLTVMLSPLQAVAGKALLLFVLLFGIEILISMLDPKLSRGRRGKRRVTYINGEAFGDLKRFRAAKLRGSRAQVRGGFWQDTRDGGKRWSKW